MEQQARPFPRPRFFFSRMKQTMSNIFRKNRTPKDRHPKKDQVYVAISPTCGHCNRQKEIIIKNDKDEDDDLRNELIFVDCVTNVPDYLETHDNNELYNLTMHQPINGLQQVCNAVTVGYPSWYKNGEEIAMGVQDVKAIDSILN